MVVFTCNYCGESLQKPKVEKHYNFVCRTTKSLTCIDCLKDFRGEEYANHTKCLTEEERYAAKGAFVNGIVKKGEVKQESWIEMLKSIIEKETNLKPSVRNLLNTISNYCNVPRKKPKFLNFVKSSSGGRASMKEVEEVWDIIEKYKASQLNNSKPQENGDNKLNKTSNSASSPEESTVNDTADKPNGTTENGIKKRKKKSRVENTLENGNETLQIEKNNDNTIQDTKKSKKIKHSNENLEKIDVDLVEESTDIKEKKIKKLKKKEVENSKMAESNVTFENGNNESVDLSNNNQETDIKKKSKKKKMQNTDTEEVNNAKKVKLDITNEGNCSEISTVTEVNFDFGQKILEIMTSKGSISTKKLEKKVVNAYLKHFGLSESSPKILKKFSKKLKKLNNIEIVDDNVTLKT